MKSCQSQLAVTIGKASLFGALALASVASAQNVGIGFSNPQSKLTVDGNLAVGTDYNVAAPANGAILEGTVGIGTSSPNPSTKLHLFDASTCYLLMEGSGTNGSVLNLINDSTSTLRSVIEMTNSNLTAGFQLVTDESATGVNTFVIYDIAAKANRVFINPSGDVGVNTVNPRWNLEVNGIAAVSGGGLSYPSTINAFAIGWNNIQPGDGITELVNYQGTGNAGPCFEFFRVPNTGAPSTGNVIAAISESGVYSSSDKRLKTDIEPLHYGLHEIMALKPKEYDFHLGKSIKEGIVELEPEKSHQLGFIAQDLYHIVPEVVEKPKDEKTDLYRLETLEKVINNIQVKESGKEGAFANK